MQWKQNGQGSLFSLFYRPGNKPIWKKALVLGKIRTTVLVIFAFFPRKFDKNVKIFVHMPSITCGKKKSLFWIATWTAAQCSEWFQICRKLVGVSSEKGVQTWRAVHSLRNKASYELKSNKHLFHVFRERYWKHMTLLLRQDVVVWPT